MSATVSTKSGGAGIPDELIQWQERKSGKGNPYIGVLLEPSEKAMAEFPGANHGEEVLLSANNQVMGYGAPAEPAQQLSGKYLAPDCEMVGVGLTDAGKMMDAIEGAEQSLTESGSPIDVSLQVDDRTRRRARGIGASATVNWPVADNRWKKVNVLGIVEYKLFEQKWLWYTHRLDFDTTRKSTTYRFWDESGDYYDKVAIVGGHYMIRYSSSQPNINRVETL